MNITYTNIHNGIKYRIYIIAKAFAMDSVVGSNEPQKLTEAPN